MARKLKIALFLSYIVFAGQLKAEILDNNYCDQKRLGWHFYCEKKKQEVSEKSNEQVLQSPSDKLAAIKQKLEELKVNAIMNPTEENVAAYIEYQQAQIRRAAKFSRVWRRVQWKNPKLDYRVKHPVTTEGLDAVYKEKNIKVEQALKDIGERYGIFYFYKGKQIRSQKFASIVKGFADYYKLNVMGVSLDGVVVREFPDSKIDKGEIKVLGIKTEAVPSIALYDSKEDKLIPVSSGMIGVGDLETRLYLLTKVEEVDDEDF